MTVPSEPLAQGGAPRSRSQFWLLVAVFFAPLATAFLLYYGAGGWRPVGNTNHGQLIQPPHPIPELDLTAPDGTSLPPSLLRDKWSLVYAGSGQCDARCREALTLMRQSRLALNDDIPRVQRIFLATEACCDQDYLQAHHTGLIVVRLDRADGERLQTIVQDATPEPLAEAGRIFIVDPLGNLMMSYSPDTEPKGLLLDLKKLLKLSHIG